MPTALGGKTSRQLYKRLNFSPFFIINIDFERVKLIMTKLIMTKIGET